MTRLTRRADVLRLRGFRILPFVPRHQSVPNGSGLSLPDELCGYCVGYEYFPHQLGFEYCVDPACDKLEPMYAHTRCYPQGQYTTGAQPREKNAGRARAFRREIGSVACEGLPLHAKRRDLTVYSTRRCCER